jgi:hypothetical protein
MIKISKRNSFLGMLFILFLTFGCGGGGGDDGGSTPPPPPPAVITLESQTMCPASALGEGSPKQPSMFVTEDTTCGVISSVSDSCITSLFGAIPDAFSGLLGDNNAFVVCIEASQNQQEGQLVGILVTDPSSQDSSTVVWKDLDEERDFDTNEIGFDPDNVEIQFTPNQDALTINTPVASDSSSADRFTFTNGACEETQVRDLPLLELVGDENVGDFIDTLNNASDCQ